MTGRGAEVWRLNEKLSKAIGRDCFMDAVKVVQICDRVASVFGTTFDETLQATEQAIVGGKSLESFGFSLKGKKPEARLASFLGQARVLS